MAQKPFGISIPFCSTPKILAPQRGFTILSAPPTSPAIGFTDTTVCHQPASSAYSTTFDDTGEMPPTRMRFRAFITTHFWHVVLPFLESLLATYIWCFANNTSLRPCSRARRFPQSPVVRSERSQTDKLLRFTFATTCQFAKALPRTC